jgi:cytochrome oxidase Cu insertion factor (SCO1/SenC/PrrC family)
MQRISAALLVCVLLLSIAAAWFLWRTADSVASPGSDTTLAQVGGPFALTDQDGHHRTDKDFRGRFVLLYFGYTYCPDVCPTTLALMANTLGKLGAKANLIIPVFITIDPARDTPRVLKSYLDAFGARFVGLTGKPADIDRVAHAYRVYYEKRPLPGGGYSVDHSSVIYLLDRDGKFVKAYDDAAKSQAIADDLEKQL